MLVDQTYWWLYWRAQEAAYLNLFGQTEYYIVEKYAGHLTDQIRKLNEGGLLKLANLPSA
jgi:hypothetical protein